MVRIRLQSLIFYKNIIHTENIIHTFSVTRTSTKRLLFLCSIFMVRGWGLYVFLNMMEDIVLSSNILSSSSREAVLETTDLDSCWFSPLFKSWQRKFSEEGDKCYGVEFDFSDHVVLFFSHSYPSMIFEAMFCFLVPFIPKERKHLNTSPYIKQPGGLHRVLEYAGSVEGNRHPGCDTK